jgi:hypothetical protein
MVYKRIITKVFFKDITICQEELNGKDLEQLESALGQEGKNAAVLPIKKRQSNQSVYQLCYWYFMGVTV